MDYINPPATPIPSVTHQTFYSELYSHEIGYNIYLPPDYEILGKKFPVSYHLHGWTGNESTEIGTLSAIYTSRDAITVFPNNSPVIESNENLPVESMIMHELIPHIDGKYKTIPTREDRSVSGFSMGGGMALYYAVKYPELFASIIAFAGTYHHYYHKEYRGVGAAPDKAAELYESMMREERYLEKGNILTVIRQNTEEIRGKLDITMHIGSADVLFCDNEILHTYLDSLSIPHRYVVFNGAGHELAKIL